MSTLELLTGLMNDSRLADFVLVGGTAIAYNWKPIEKRVNPMHRSPDIVFDKPI
jgi:hypothetical protein